MNKDRKGRLILGWVGLVPVWVVCWVKMGDFSGWEASLCFATPFIVLGLLIVSTLAALAVERLERR